MNPLIRRPDLACALLVLAAVAGAAGFTIGLRLPWADAGPGRDAVPALIRATFGEQATAALCVAGSESSWNPRALNVNDDGSEDRGLFQINSRWHPDVSDAQAYDLVANVHYAHALSLGGMDWSAWAETTRVRCDLP
jgi:hypothetical protein